LGFSQVQVEKAIAATGASVEAAVDWILAHPEAAATDSPASGAPTTVVPRNTGGGSPPVVHNALCNNCKDQIIGTRHKCQECKDYDLCDECYKKRVLLHEPDHEFGHFTEDIPMPERKPLTPEERQAALKKLEEKRKEILRLKQEEEKKAEKERELKRRQMGKEIVAAKEKWKEEQIKLDLAQRKKEKQDEAAAKREIKERLAREKAAKLAAKQGSSAPSTTVQPSQPPVATASSNTSSSATEAVVQVRMPDGKTMQKTFRPDDTLRAVYTWVQSSRTDSRAFALSTTLPRRDYHGGLLDTTTIRAADLMPRGALIVKNL